MGSDEKKDHEEETLQEKPSTKESFVTEEVPIEAAEERIKLLQKEIDDHKRAKEIDAGSANEEEEDLPKEQEETTKKKRKKKARDSSEEKENMESDSEATKRTKTRKKKI